MVFGAEWLCWTLSLPLPLPFHSCSAKILVFSYSGSKLNVLAWICFLNFKAFLCNVYAEVRLLVAELNIFGVPVLCCSGRHHGAVHISKLPWKSLWNTCLVQK